MEKQPLVKHQPTAMVGSIPTDDFRSSLFDCFNPFSEACFTLCCLPCALANARTKYDQSNWCFSCMSLTPAALRNIVREGYHIRGDCCSDIFAGACIPCCTVLQVSKEVDIRGPPAAKRVQTTSGLQWNNGLFNCMNNTGNCCYGCLCPHCAIATARSNFDGSNCCFNFMCITPALTRNVIREGYGLEGGCCFDILVTCCFPSCAACQLLNEVESRGPVNAVVG